jgi:phosphate uptake regulator
MSIAEDTLTALTNGDKEALKGIERRDLDVDKFTNFCLRILNKKGYKQYDITAVMYDLIQELEELCDNYEGISNDLLDVDSFKMRKEMISIFKESNGLIRHFYELFYDFSKDRMSELHKKRKKVMGGINNLRNIKPHERTILYHLRKVNDDLLELIKLKITSYL